MELRITFFDFIGTCELKVIHCLLILSVREIGIFWVMFS
jgi:hypothetical protein